MTRDTGALDEPLQDRIAQAVLAADSPDPVGTGADVTDPDVTDPVGTGATPDGGSAPLDPEDPASHLIIVRRAAEAERISRDLLLQAVGAARASGHSWAAIGRELGMSRQAAQQRFGGADAVDAVTTSGADAPAAAPETRRLGPITALDEMAELAIAGRQGWRTVGAGMFYHLVKRTETRWEHRRVVWAGPAQRFERDGWQVALRAFPWIYLVRDLGLPPEQP